MALPGTQVVVGLKMARGEPDHGTLRVGVSMMIRSTMPTLIFTPSAIEEFELKHCIG